MTQKKNYRLAQVNRLLREEIAAVLLTEIQDERLRDLTVTEVRASRDLKHGIVFVTTGKGHDPKESLDAARRSAGFIRRVLYGRLHLKHIPELDFHYDESLEKAERIFQTLKDLDLKDDDEEPTEE